MKSTRDELIEATREWLNTLSESHRRHKAIEHLTPEGIAQLHMLNAWRAQAAASLSILEAMPGQHKEIEPRQCWPSPPRRAPDQPFPMPGDVIDVKGHFTDHYTVTEWGRGGIQTRSTSGCPHYFSFEYLNKQGFTILRRGFP